MIPIEQTEDWKKLCRIISSKTRFIPNDYNQSFLKRRVDVRLRSLTMTSLVEYAKKLESDPQEIVALEKEFAIHVTHFFRDYSAWQYLQEKVLPTLFEQNTQVKIWSAGSSYGEEATTLAILCTEVCKKIGKTANFSITGTDIDFPTVKRAGEFLYDPGQLRETPQHYKDTYFEIVENGMYRPIEDIRKHIYFEQLDLIKDKQKFSKFSGYTMICCRNTVIYFSEQTKEQLYLDYYNLLVKGGVLMLGKTESMIGEAREKFTIINTQERLFQKE